MPDQLSPRATTSDSDPRSRARALRVHDPDPGPDVGPDAAAATEPVPASGHDPVSNLAFWGPHRGTIWRPRLASLAERLRADPRAGGVALLVVALAVGFGWYRIGASGASGASDASSAGRAPAASRSETSKTKTKKDATAGARVSRAPSVVVHVAGAVARPGVVRLTPGARVIDALEAAGGARAGADTDRLNLAAKVVDGQRIVLGVAGAASGPEPPSAGADGAATPEPINLNTATVSELDALPGIGPTLAAAVVRERERRGGFQSVDELRSVRGIGDKRFSDLRALVTL